MVICSRCGKEVGNLFCGHCREEVIGKLPAISSENLVPLLFWDKEKQMYVFGCSVKECPCNREGRFCSSWIPDLVLAMFIMHEYDGDNICKQNCG